MIPKFNSFADLQRWLEAESEKIAKRRFTRKVEAGGGDAAGMISNQSCTKRNTGDCVALAR